MDVSPGTGTIKLNFPKLEVWEMETSCVLDIADEGGMKFESMGELLNVTRERIRQIEVKALAKLKRFKDLQSFADGGDENEESYSGYEFHLGPPRPKIR